ncbi:MAG TPA: hypothetical protein VLB86_10185 [Gaiellaceae bacterium]|nr:hypothetical protein [Gaiellaceae bacterium]
MAEETRFCDELDVGFGWYRAGEALRRTSHALAADGGVWLVDPVDAEGVEGRVRVLGEPRGVIQLLDRHERDGAAWAARLGVPLHVVPFVPVAGAPFVPLPLVRSRWWREAALWWHEPRVLVVADALGTISYFRAGDEPIGVHPLLRLRPPRALATLDPAHVLVGHGSGLHGAGTTAAVREAIVTARRRLPQAWAAAALSPLRRRRR